MELTILLYNTVYTSVLTLAMACSYYLYIRSKQKEFLFIGAIFMIYLADNTMVYCTEMIKDFSQRYNEIFVSTASFKTVYYICLIGCMICVYYNIMKPPSPMLGLIAMGVYAAILICVPTISSPTWRIFLYFVPTQIMMAGIAIAGIVTLQKNPEKYQQAHFYIFHMILIILLACSILIVLEDAVVIFYYDRYSGNIRIINRSISENVMFFLMAIIFIKHTADLLMDTRHRMDRSEKRAQEEKDSVTTFSKEYDLTERECDILRLLLEGKSQQEISESLVIALGTVKTHIHNIYQKADVTKRSEMIKSYQSFCESCQEDRQMI